MAVAYLQRVGQCIDVWRLDPDTVQTFAGTEHIAAMSGRRVTQCLPALQPSAFAYPLLFGQAKQPADRKCVQLHSPQLPVS